VVGGALVIPAPPPPTVIGIGDAVKVISVFGLAPELFIGELFPGAVEKILIPPAPPPPAVSQPPPPPPATTT
jgi:hypothetical protein